MPVPSPVAALRASPAVQIALTVAFNLVCYVAIGLPLAVIPGFTHRVLGFDAVLAGFAVSVQYLATFASRPAAGRMADTAGPKRSVLIGLGLCAGSGLLLVLSGLSARDPWPSLGLLFVSRGLLGCAESCVSTGCITWAIGRVGFARAAQVISINGITSYGGIALGAPIGLALAGSHGLVPLGALTALLGGAGLVLALPRAPTAALGGGMRAGFGRILGRVAPYGIALALGSIGFGVIAAFVTLFYGQQEWPHAGRLGPGAALSVFGIAFVAVRMAFSGEIARRGGLAVGMASLGIEALGLLLVWRAPVPLAAVAGSGIAGAGFALLFPALGVLAVARVPPQSRGSAIGAYSVFLDLSIGLSGPLLGLVAARAGYRSLFLCAALAAAAGLVLCLWLRRRFPGLPPAAPVG